MFTNYTASDVLDIVPKLNDSLGEIQQAIDGSGGGYVLPAATASVLGGVKIGSGVNVAADGTISVAGGGSYELPVATATTLGGIKRGASELNALTIGSDGSANVSVGIGLSLTPDKTIQIKEPIGTQIGGVGTRAGSSISVNSIGLIDVKTGSGITKAADGTLSVSGGGGNTWTNETIMYTVGSNAYPFQRIHDGHTMHLYSYGVNLPAGTTSLPASFWLPSGYIATEINSNFNYIKAGIGGSGEFTIGSTAGISYRPSTGDLVGGTNTQFNTLSVTLPIEKVTPAEATAWLEAKAIAKQMLAETPAILPAEFID